MTDLTLTDLAWCQHDDPEYDPDLEYEDWWLRQHEDLVAIHGAGYDAWQPPEEEDWTGDFTDANPW